MGETQIVLYYDESNTRRKHRVEILTHSAEYFSVHGWEGPTMAELSSLIDIERRTLYSYYNNKTDLLVDAFLFAAEEFSLRDFDSARETQGKTRNLPAQERLEAILGQQARFLLNGHERHRLVLSYDEFVKHLPIDSSTFQRFLLIRGRVAARVNILGEVMRQLDDAGDILKMGVEPEQLGLVVEQAFRAYILRIAERRHYTDHYNTENIDLFIKILITGLVPKK